MARNLSSKQITSLAVIAQKAWRQAGFALDFASVDDFRHATCFDATGKESFRKLEQADFVPAWNAFATLAGVPPRPDRTPDAQAKAVRILEIHLHRHELTVGYVAALVRDKFHITRGTSTTVAELCATLSASQVWQLVYTVNNRGRSKTRKVAATCGAGDVPEPHTAITMPPGGLAEHFGAVLVEPQPVMPKRKLKTAATS